MYGQISSNKKKHLGDALLQLAELQLSWDEQKWLSESVFTLLTQNKNGLSTDCAAGIKHFQQSKLQRYVF